MIYSHLKIATTILVTLEQTFYCGYDPIKKYISFILPLTKKTQRSYQNRCMIFYVKYPPEVLIFLFLISQ